MPDEVALNDALDLLSRATATPVTIARFTQWLATSGRDALETAASDPQSLKTLKGIVEALIVSSKLARRALGDEAEQGYPQDEMLRRLLEVGTSYGCTSEMLWAAQRAVRGPGDSAG